MIIMLFINDTATTEIYTYSHPFSLHVALPISDQFETVLRPVEIRDIIGDLPQPGPQRLARPDRGTVQRSRRHPRRPRRPGGRPCLVDRSEEHTSELQSLMSISYAVFCLKKKNEDIMYIRRQQLKQSRTT